MNALIVLILIGGAALTVFRLRQRRSLGPGLLTLLRERRQAAAPARPRPQARPPFLGDAGLVAAREARERIRGRLFRAGTLLLLATVAAAIVIPVLTKAKSQTQHVGVAGSLAAPLRAGVVAAGQSVGTSVRLVPERDAAAARAALRSGRIGVAIVDGARVVTGKPAAAASTSVTARLARAVSRTLGADEALRDAGLSPGQVARLARARPLPLASLQPGHAASGTVSDVGLILVFLMLTQYNTWTLIGVMEEKSSRVVEVLLAAVRPVQLLCGKVLGIGLVAFAQAAVVVAFALGLAKAVGSDLLQGTAPLVLASTLAWLVLGYAFYSWVYAAAGSLAERRDQVQSLIFPLALPVMFGYLIALTTIASGSPSALLEALAYLPPTAPFAMPALVALGQATWWEFTASALISVACTAGAAWLAAGVYRRAILRTGGRVRLREVLSG